VTRNLVFKHGEGEKNRIFFSTFPGQAFRFPRRNFEPACQALIATPAMCRNGEEERQEMTIAVEKLLVMILISCMNGQKKGLSLPINLVSHTFLGIFLLKKELHFD